MFILDFVKNIKTENRKAKLDKELLQALSYIRNNIILGSESGISSEILMQELAEISDGLRPAFLTMGQYLHINDKENAAEVLYKYFGNGFSKDLGRVLSGWEDIPPEDLLETIEIYVDTLREENLERKRQNDEIISDIIYFPVVMNAMLVMYDFVYVAYFIEQQKLFEQLF